MADRDPTRPIEDDGSADATRVIQTTPSQPRSTTPEPDLRSRVDPLKWVGWPLGGALVVWSLVALARTGFDDLDPYVVTEVAGISTSRLLAAIVLVMGLLIWSGVAGSVPRDVEIRVIGASAIVLGLVLLIEPDPFRPYLGIDGDFGAVAVGVGVLLVGASLVHPFPIGRKSS